MKRLYVVRHAKSSWSDASLSDHDRPLNKRGKRDGPAMAWRMREAGHSPQLIVSSTARRALKTAKIFASEFEYPIERIVRCETMYLARVSSMIELVAQLDDTLESVMLVGHNPGLTGLINTLGDVELDNLPTSGAFCLDLPIERWQDIRPNLGAPVSWYDFPKKTR